MLPLELELPTRRATIRLARVLAPHLGPGDLLALSGELGSGKTFFVRALCRALGLPARTRVTSPSFALINEYQARIPIVHADLYRMGSADEARHLGLREMRSYALLVVEWAAPYVAALGGGALHLELCVDDRGRRARLDSSLPPDDLRLGHIARDIGLRLGP